MKIAALLAVLVIITTGCNNTEKAPEKQSRFLVDKIYDFNDKLIGEYFYDTSNHLIKCKFRNGNKVQDIDYDFEYTNNLVSTITVSHLIMVEYNHKIHISYNKLGHIIKSQIEQPGVNWMAENYKYRNNGQLEYAYDNEGNQYFTPDYEQTLNLMQVKYIRTDPIEGKKEYHQTFTYDNHPKPDFGAGNIFQIELLPYFGTAATMESYLSKNNMTTFADHQWIYTYNSNGLPATIESKYKGVEYETPLLLKIKYKQVYL